jgi:hypothetical protein|tara:strand:- start:474 stop:578 length:105 start_codon:yes stop_codon:yes gene_type:complete
VEQHILQQVVGVEQDLLVHVVVVLHLEVQVVGQL